MNALSALIYDIFLETFYGKILKKLINFFFFSLKKFKKYFLNECL